jgi:hypothetical protein
MKCILCSSNDVLEQFDCAKYYYCNSCDLRFLNPNFRLSSTAEKNHYDQHNNDINDPRYKKFVEPLFLEIFKRVSSHSLGLDYGAGPGPVLASMLKEKNIYVDLYDPYFLSDVDELEKMYDFVYASESVEHFYNPYKEFLNIKQHMVKDGIFAIMTHMYSPDISFKDWYYRKDPTHVGFYSEKTMLWIKNEFQFKNLEIVSDRVAVFS